MYIVNRMSDSTTVKIFKSGNSQAVRLPKEFRFSGKTARLVRMGGGSVMLVDPKVIARRRAALRKIWDAAPDFPEAG
jgi:antitoxin VapB